MFTGHDSAVGFSSPGYQGAPALGESTSSHMLSSVLQLDTPGGEHGFYFGCRWSSLLYYFLTIYTGHQSQDHNTTWNQWHLQENMIFVKNGDYYYSEKFKLDWIRDTKEQGKNENLSSNLFIFEISLQVFGYIPKICRLG